MFQNYKRKKMAKLRRKVKAERLASVEYRQQESEKQARSEVLAVLRQKITVGVSDIIASVGVYYPNNHSDIRNIHDRVQMIISAVGDHSFSSPGSMQKLMGNLLWMSTVLPENQNRKIQDVLEFLTQYGFKRWGAV